jgi:predicted glutamine amidotransferase
MCRWVAYAGSEIYLEDLIFHQEHSIVSQRLAATQSARVTNGDGFGVAWYNNRITPGLFKDILPAWNDSNLRSLATHIQTRLFFAHVRATTGTAVNRSNCHPFTRRNWTFMHNGKIGNWHDCRKDVEDLIDHVHYPHREGTTDSQALFLVALSKGLIHDPIKAMQATLRDVTKIMDQHHADEPMRISCTLSPPLHQSDLIQMPPIGSRLKNIKECIGLSRDLSISKLPSSTHRGRAQFALTRKVADA